MTRYRKTRYIKAFVLSLLLLLGLGSSQEAAETTSTSTIRVSSSPENTAIPNELFVSETTTHTADLEETSVSSIQKSEVTSEVTLVSNLPNNADKTPWSRLPNNTGDYCPRANVCMWNDRNNETLSTNAGVIPCCTDCSCDYATCGKEDNCCFPELNQYQSVYRSSQTCTHLLTPVPANGRSLRKAYYVVDKNPLGGCVGAKDVLETEECGGINVAPWGSLYPAFSNGVLFRNIRCAECHGVTDAVVLPVVQSCLSIDQIMGLSVRTFTDLPLLTGSECYVHFKYEKIEKELKRCYTDVINHCKSGFEVPQGVRLTKNEIEEACRSEFHSPYVSVVTYANVFCFMCNNGIHEDTVCREQLDVKGGGRSSISVLLDPAVVHEMQHSKTDTSNENKACVHYKEQSDCRQVQCPSGRINAKGSCVFISKIVYETNYLVCLKLIPILDTSETAALMKKLHITESQEKLKLTWAKAPWKTKWIVYGIYIPTYNSSIDENVTKELIVCMSYEPYSVEPKQLLTEMENSLKIWTFSLGDKTIKMSQSLAEFRLINLVKRNGNGVDEFSPIGIGYCANEPKDVSIDILKDKTYNRIVANGIRPLYARTIITRLYFCEQIELKFDEFVMYCNGLVLYYISRMVYLYDSQFALRDNGYGNYTARICLHDSLFEVSSNSRSSKSSVPTGSCFVVAVMLIFILCV